MAKAIMVQGTMSNSGKSFLAAALCRIFKQDGYKVAPFKSQNMALNSYITKDGLEIGRAQAMQAEAAGIPPTVEMNPILLKPTSHMGSQVIVNGEVFGNLKAMDYYHRQREFIPAVKQAWDRLDAEYDIIVLEGAGSPAEINLREHDIVNMGMAKIAKAPVLLVGDIDRGGVFASLYGTVGLLEPDEQAMIKGLIINKFRGDKKILEPGLRMIEEKLNIPVLGVIPMESIDLDEEDSLCSRLVTGSGVSKEVLAEGLDIVVIRLPHISNFTDFHVLEQMPGVFLRYVNRPSQLGTPDLVILPGTKNTMADLKWLRESGLESGILRLVAVQIPLLGICGGYQMLGRSVSDPDYAEGGGEIRGMGLLDVETIFAEQKTRTRISGKMIPSDMFANESMLEVTGYEIHMGMTRPVLHKQEGCEAVGEVVDEMAGNMNGEMVGGINGKPVITLADGRMDGMERADGLLFGSYLHGLFDNAELTNALLLRLAEKKGIKLSNPAGNWADYKETQYEKLADLVRRSLDMNAVYEILEKHPAGIP